MDCSAWWQGVKSMVPLAVSIAGCGVAWGTLARQGGMTLPEIFLMSSVVFAGASQFVAVGMLGGIDRLAHTEFAAAVSAQTLAQTLAKPPAATGAARV